MGKGGVMEIAREGKETEGEGNERD